MKEHIDEMTKVLVDYTEKNRIMASHVILEDYAEQLYNAGYRKQNVGEWIWDKEHSNYKCSLCGEYDIGVPKFCRECGAKMKGGAE